MNETSRLAEVHVREWEWHLGRVDELMQRAIAAQGAQPASPEFQAQLAEIQRDRDRVAETIAQLRRQPFDAWPDEAVHPHGLRGTLERIGDQLEKVLTAVFARP